MSETPQTIEVETVQTDAELAGETLAALAVDRQSGRVRIPPVTAGDLPLFELLCPAALREGDCTVLDTLTALYLLHCGGAALSGVWRAVAALDACDSSVALSVASADHLRAYLDARAVAERDRAEFKAAVTAFGRKLPAFDFQDAMGQIRASVREGCYGFEMVPAPAQGEKKTAGGSTRNGSGGWCARLAKWCRLTRRRCCGAGRLR